MERGCVADQPQPGEITPNGSRTFPLEIPATGFTTLVFEPSENVIAEILSWGRGYR